jgi:hypothetical protein
MWRLWFHFKSPTEAEEKSAMRSIILVSAFSLVVLNGLSGCGDSKNNDMKSAEEAARKEAAAKAPSTPTNPHGAMNPSNPHGVMGQMPPPPSEGIKCVAEAPVGDFQKLKVGTLEITLPSTWKNEVPGNSMRMAQYRIPKVGDDKEDGELRVTNLFGGVDGNLDRWAKEMGLVDASKGVRKQIKTADGLEATFGEFEGTYSSMGSTPMAGYKMLVGYFVRQSGEYQLKLFGPAATINAAKAGFEKMIESFK